MRTKASIIIATTMLTGCAGFSDPGRTTLAGSGTIFQKEDFSDRSICGVLETFSLASPVTNESVGCTIEEGPSVDVAARNGFAQYVMALSDQKCGFYKRAILSRRASINYSLGSVATLLAGAGAVISHADTAQAFSAAAAVATGVRSEFEQAYFSNLAVEIISSGIDQRRSEIREEVAKRMEENTTKYPVAGALRDALEYHAACSAVVGLEEAKEAISRVDDPGIETIKRVLELVGTLNKAPEDAVGGQADTTDTDVGGDQTSIVPTTVNSGN